ncbi:MAG: hypothetical protein NZU63_13845 [Gemmataceae bacterium]|nr:hypothetical protein [Gemmataceae bacterium]MDW8242915.1 hypothetical protein [Thermogemmata sp.]
MQRKENVGRGQERGSVALIGLLLLAGSGCISTGYDGWARIEEINAIHPISAVQRNRVYVFLVSDLNPGHMLQVERWRTRWQEAGFAKIAVGQAPFHLGWMKYMMRSLRSADPECVCAVAVHGAAWSLTRTWLQECLNEGLPIATIFVVGDHRTTDSISRIAGVTMVTAEDSTAGHAEILGHLAALASSRSLPQAPPQQAWSYPWAPSSRPEADPSRYPEWSYLFDDRPQVIPNPAVQVSTPLSPTDCSTVQDNRAADTASR